MAVMASPPADGLLDEKANGNIFREVNGHASSDHLTHALKSPISSDEARSQNNKQAKSLETSRSQNSDAFVSYQTMPDAATTDDGTVTPPIEAELTHEPIPTGDSADVIMDDAPVQKQPNFSPSTTATTKEKAEADTEMEGGQQVTSPTNSSLDFAVQTPDAPFEVKVDADMADLPPKADTIVDTAATTVKKSSATNEPLTVNVAADGSLPEDPAVDQLAITDTVSTSAGLCSSENVAIDDTRPVDTKEEADARPTSTVQSSEEPPTMIGNGDVSILDAPKSGPKVSREREDDGNEEPFAKRVKVEPEGTGPAAMSDGHTVDADSVEPSKAASLLTHDTESAKKPLFMSDPAIDQTPITDWQSRQLRDLMGRAKKTKSGAAFKKPVPELWPQLGDDYLQKVSDPIDIQTIEQKLRGEKERYTNWAAFRADVQRLHSNAVLFNGEGHEVSTQAEATIEYINSRLRETRVEPPPKNADRKETPKMHPKRHAEPKVPTSRTQLPTPKTQHAPSAAPSTPSAVSQQPERATQASVSGTQKPVESPAFAIPPNSGGVPQIRRDSTKGGDNRSKRPVVPPKSKDIPYESSKRKKLTPDLKFCQSILDELKKVRYTQANHFFLQPVDPVALNIPTYHNKVKKPMDLGTMGDKLAAGEYKSGKDFEKDFNLIVYNCKLFNGDSHPVTDAALTLENVFKKEWAKRDEFLAKHAPVGGPHSVAQSQGVKDDELEEEGEEDDFLIPEPEVSEVSTKQVLVDRLQILVDQENKNISDQLKAPNPDLAVVKSSQDLLNKFQLDLIDAKIKLAEAQDKKKTSKPAKTKKASAATAAASASKKGGVKKSAGGGRLKAAPKRKLKDFERDVITTGIGELDGKPLERAIDLIKKDTGQAENEAGELELDIEQVSEDALVKLFDIIVKAIPEIQEEMDRKREQLRRDRSLPPPARTSGPSKANKAAAAKMKKNKPMSKTEQERRIQQLNQLRANAQRQGSGSQEPMESIEGGSPTAGGAGEPAITLGESDEEDSEEE